jgi:hypothetical protein
MRRPFPAAKPTATSEPGLPGRLLTEEVRELLAGEGPAQGGHARLSPLASRPTRSSSMCGREVRQEALRVAHPEAHVGPGCPDEDPDGGARDDQA